MTVGAPGFYGDAEDAPIQEVILPFTTSSEELALIEAYYRNVIVGQEDRPLRKATRSETW